MQHLGVGGVEHADRRIAGNGRLTVDEIVADDPAAVIVRRPLDQPERDFALAVVNVLPSAIVADEPFHIRIAGPAS